MGLNWAGIGPGHWHLKCVPIALGYILRAENHLAGLFIHVSKLLIGICYFILFLVLLKHGIVRMWPCQTDKAHVPIPLQIHTGNHINQVFCTHISSELGPKESMYRIYSRRWYLSLKDKDRDPEDMGTESWSLSAVMSTYFYLHPSKTNLKVGWLNIIDWIN